MDNIICPTCENESYINQIGCIGNWQWWQCDICDNRHWRNKGGITQLQKDAITKGLLYAAIERDRNRK